MKNRPSEISVIDHDLRQAWGRVRDAMEYYATASLYALKSSGEPGGIAKYNEVGYIASNCAGDVKAVDGFFRSIKPVSGEPDLNKCPKCGGVADNGHDRCLPPNSYYCTKCEAMETEQPVEETDLRVDTFEGNSTVRVTHSPTGMVSEANLFKARVMNRCFAMGVLSQRLREREAVTDGELIQGICDAYWAGCNEDDDVAIKLLRERFDIRRRG